MEGKIFDIQRFSIYDGPGIRTNVFFKGCNLRCLWCHNPESQKAEKQLLFYKDKCIGCGACTEICNKTHTDECTACGRCADVCHNAARKISGRLCDSDEIVAEVMRDKEFYKTSGGGVTLSGGEPMLQPDFAAEILKKCKEHNIHTAVETAGNVKWDCFQKVLPYTDLVLFDIKCMNEKKHAEYTGASNKLILENAERIKNSGVKILFRTPVIPDYNDTEIKAIADFCKPFDYEILAYHKTGCGKYNALGLDYALSAVEAPSKEFMQRLADENIAIYRYTGV